MVFSSREETHDSNIPSNTSSRTLTCQGSISNFSVHTASTATTHDEDLNIDPSGQGPDRDFPIPDHKSSYSLEKLTLGLRNQSLSTVCTSEPESDRSTIETSTPKQELRSLSPPSPEDEVVSSPPSTPRSSAYSPVTDPSPSLSLSTPLDDLLTNLYGDSQPPAIIEISKADKAPIRPVHILPPPTDRLSTISRSRSGSVTTKGKKGMLGFMTDFLNSNKRPEISTAYDPVHLTHVGFNSSTREFTGLPMEWEQGLQDSGISKSDQEKNPLAVMEIVKFFQEGGGDVWDKMGHAPAPGGSQSPPIPGTIQSAFPGLSKSVDDSFVSTVSVSIIPHSRILTVHSGRRYRLRKRPTPPAAHMVHPHLTHIALRHLHRSLRSLISTGLTLNDQCPSRLAVTHSSAQTPGNHPTPRPRILHLSHKLL
jgi:P21-Rho-binding domain